MLFFELIGGDFKHESNDNSTLSGKELLDNPKTREDIELESIESNVSSLWSSQASRNVFLEIVSNIESIGFLALALELLCRNTRSYFDANRIKGTPASSAATVQGSFPGYEQYAPLPMRTTRRMNAWQLTQQESDDQTYWEQPRLGIRSTRRANVDYTEY